VVVQRSGRQPGPIENLPGGEGLEALLVQAGVSRVEQSLPHRRLVLGAHFRHRNPQSRIKIERALDFLLWERWRGQPWMCRQPATAASGTTIVSRLEAIAWVESTRGTAASSS